ncbi:MAG TPA: hypothetical protein VFE02_17860 [Candidatus Acidoferrales bacterium]|jgi:hypothetical protein|nr:hypothetical protein [Candidatus Acidoferrales bacterium]
MRNVLMGAVFTFIATLYPSSPAHAQSANSTNNGNMNAPVSRGANLLGVWSQFPRIGSRSAGEGGFVFSKEEPPMTPWALEKFKSTKAPHTGGYTGESDDTTLKCDPPGVPRIYLFNFPMEILVVPDRVLIVHEFGHFIRQIWTDGRPHPQNLNPSWMGDSIGKWEGDTLVVDTIGFNDKTWLDQVGHPHTENLHLVERIRRSGPDLLQIDFTFDDPKAYTKPWTGTKQFKLHKDWQISEYICEENFENKAIDEISK